MALSMFIPSTTGMEAYSHAITQVSTNIANMNTVGYKTNQTMFYTLLGSSPVVKNNNTGINSSKADIQGVGYYDRTLIEKEGLIEQTGGNYDVAINGNGNAFFTLQDAYNNVYYTRAGDFGTQTIKGQTYLVAHNGMKVQGFAALEGGGFSDSAEDIILSYPERIPARATTTAAITANVPADDVEASSYGIPVYAENHESDSLTMTFKKVEGKVNTWDLSFSVEGGTASGSVGEVIFNTDGKIVSPKNLTVDIQWDDGPTNNILLDLSEMTQYAGGVGTVFVKQNGAASGDLQKTSIDDNGILKATYSNGDTHNIAKLALTGFTSPDNLYPIDQTLFEANSDTGDSYFVTGAYIIPEALERSTVDVIDQFGVMMITQRAYSSNANAFTVNDEMLQTAVNLKT